MALQGNCEDTVGFGVWGFQWSCKGTKTLRFLIYLNGLKACEAVVGRSRRD